MSDGERRKPRPVSARPRSVRDGMPGEGDPPEILVEERDVEVAGTTWSVQAVGRARVRSGGSGTPLVQLIYRAEGEEAREALVLGRRLEDLTEDALLEGFRTSRPHRADLSPRPFFEGTDTSTGRGRS